MKHWSYFIEKVLCLWMRGFGDFNIMLPISDLAKTQIQSQACLKQDSDKITFILKASITPTVLESKGQPA